MFGKTDIGDIDFARGFFHMIILNSIFGGLIIGKISEGEARYGLKHVVASVAVGYIACALFILPPHGSTDRAKGQYNGYLRGSAGGNCIAAARQFNRFPAYAPSGSAGATCWARRLLMIGTGIGFTLETRFWPLLLWGFSARSTRPRAMSACSCRWSRRCCRRRAPTRPHRDLRPLQPGRTRWWRRWARWPRGCRSSRRRAHADRASSRRSRRCSRSTRCSGSRPITLIAGCRQRSTRGAMPRMRRWGRHAASC